MYFILLIMCNDVFNELFIIIIVIFIFSTLFIGLIKWIISKFNETAHNITL